MTFNGRQLLMEDKFWWKIRGAALPKKSQKWKKSIMFLTPIPSARLIKTYLNSGKIVNLITPQPLPLTHIGKKRDEMRNFWRATSAVPSKQGLWSGLWLVRTLQCLAYITQSEAEFTQHVVRALQKFGMRSLIEKQTFLRLLDPLWRFIKQYQNHM